MEIGCSPSSSCLCKTFKHIFTQNFLTLAQRFKRVKETGVQRGDLCNRPPMSTGKPPLNPKGSVAYAVKDEVSHRSAPFAAFCCLKSSAFTRFKQQETLHTRTICTSCLSLPLSYLRASFLSNRPMDCVCGKRGIADCTVTLFRCASLSTLHLFQSLLFLF